MFLIGMRAFGTAAVGPRTEADARDGQSTNS